MPNKLGSSEVVENFERRDVFCECVMRKLSWTVCIFFNPAKISAACFQNSSVERCCSYSVVIIHGAYIASFSVESIVVFLH